MRLQWQNELGACMWPRVTGIAGGLRSFPEAHSTFCRQNHTKLDLFLPIVKEEMLQLAGGKFS